jgi:arsenate reductase
MKTRFQSSKQKNEDQQEKVILFVCVENVGRSQIAEGFFNHRYAPEGYRAISAGTRPVSQINPLAVQVMKEAGIDISSQKSKIITEDMIKSSTKSVNMGCIERAECPLLFINNCHSLDPGSKFGLEKEPNEHPGPGAYNNFMVRSRMNLSFLLSSPKPMN